MSADSRTSRVALHLDAADTPGVAERKLALAAVLTMVGLTPPVAGTAWLLAGPAGAASALIGLALVLMLFGMSAGLLALVASRRGGAGIGLLAGGAALRLPLYLAVLAALTNVPWVHGRSLAAATAVAVAVTLVIELRLLARTPRLFWLDVAANQPSALGYDTRS